MDSRPKRYIPADIRRQVRRRCAYGCIICGYPIFEYDHIYNLSNSEATESDAITLLCPTHHDEKTRGFLPVERVEQFNAMPFNREQPSVVRHQDGYFFGPSIVFNIGGNAVRWDAKPGALFTLLLVDGGPVIGFRRLGQFLLPIINLRDQNNRPFFTVRGGEYRVWTSLWDIEHVGTRLTLRHGRGQVALAIDIRPPNMITISRADFWANGIRFKSSGSLFEVYNTGSALGAWTSGNLAQPAQQVFMRTGVATLRDGEHLVDLGEVPNRYSWAWRLRKDAPFFRNFVVPGTDRELDASAPGIIEEGIRLHEAMGNDSAVIISSLSDVDTLHETVDMWREPGP